jgi:two-component system, LuxR family, response regulator FixJ
MDFVPTIFLINNDAAVLDALAISLRLDGLNVEICYSSDGFFKSYSSDKTGCILMDLSAPELEGLVIFKELVKRNLNLPVLFLTTSDLRYEVQEALKSGFFYTLEKPFSRAILLLRLHEILLRDF